MVVDSSTIILGAEVIGALGVIFGIIREIVRFFDRQKEQDKDIEKIKKEQEKDIKTIKEEQTMITYVLLAVLDGLKQQGCNGEVTKAHDELSKFINKKAHDTLD